MPRNSSLVDPKAGGSDPLSESHGGASKGVLSQDTTYIGKIVAITGTSYDVEIEGSGQLLQQCVWAVGIFLGLAGYRTSGRLGLGDRVMVLCGRPNYIVQTLGRDAPDEHNSRNRTHTGYGVEKLFPELTTGGAHTMPNDLLSGEFEIANLLGMALVFATNLISIKASDRAKMEVCMLNDMVRIVSDDFRHHSAAGDTTIFDDGRLSGEGQFTCHRHEAAGAKDPGPLGELPGNQYVPEEEDDPVNDTGYWRFGYLAGWLGDYLHWFVHDPINAVARIGARDQHACGRARIWSGSDGSVLVQSTADIVLERVVRVQVPRREHQFFDPEGNQPEEFERMNRSQLAAWRDSDPNKPWERAFQLRQYARWLSQVRSFARVRSADKDFAVPEIGDIPAPKTGQEDPEVKAANTSDSEYVDAYATVRIYRDGSVAAEDVSGSSLLMAGANVWLSAAKHLHLEAAGDVRITAGRNFLVKARRHIELYAAVGGILMKSRAFFRGLCELGSLFLKSDAKDPKAPDYEPPEVPEEDPEPEILDHAVMIQASQGKTEIKSKRTLSVHTTGSPDSDGRTDVSASVLINSKQHVEIGTARRLLVSGDSVTLSGTTFRGKFPTAGWNSNAFFVNSAFTIRRAVTYASSLRANDLQATSIKGNKIGPQPDPDIEDPPPLGVKPHYNHIGVIDDDFAMELAESNEVDAVNTLPVSCVRVKPSLVVWKLLQDSEYRWDKTGSDAYVSPTQSTLALKLELDGQDAKYVVWEWENETLLEAPETSTANKPFGVNTSYFKHEKGDVANGSGLPLNVAESTPDVKNYATDWRASKMRFACLKPS